MLRKAFTDLAVGALASRPVCAAMEPIRSTCVPVFMLHRIEDPANSTRGHSIKLIEDALVYLKKMGYNGISVHQLINLLQNNESPPKRAVVFTMDDGFQEQAKLALPLFEKYKMPITLFLATDMLDTQSWSWDYQIEYVVTQTLVSSVDVILAESPFSADLSNNNAKRHFIRKVRNHLKSKPIQLANDSVLHLADTLGISVPDQAPAGYKAMTWEDAKTLESDYVEFGPHTKQHIVLSQLNGDTAKDEITGSWNRVQEELAHPCPVFCYPTGRPRLDFGEREKQMVENAGMKAGLSAEPGYVSTKAGDINDLYSLKRFGFPNSMTDFKQYCSWIERVKEQLLFMRN